MNCQNALEEVQNLLKELKDSKPDNCSVELPNAPNEVLAKSLKENQ